MAFSISHAPPQAPERPVDRCLRDYLETHRDAVISIDKPVHLDDIGALSAQADDPVLFNNIIGREGFRLTDILVKNRVNHARALGVSKDDYLRTLAYRLRLPPRGFNFVSDAPVKEVKWMDEASVDWNKLPVPIHKEGDEFPYVTGMCLFKDPETGFYNTCHAGTTIVGPRRGLMSIVTPHTNQIMRKYLDLGESRMPVAIVFGLPPAYEIMANFSGLHMDMWGELEMVGTIMDQDIDMVPAETLDMSVPAQAEIVVEGHVNLVERFEVGAVTSPSMYRLPQTESIPEVTVTAITMRGDRPIYRNHQTCPQTDHQALPRLCHEAVLYNRLAEIGLKVKEVRMPLWGAALSVIIQVEYPWDGYVNDALMTCMGAPWLNTKMAVAISPDTDIESAESVYTAIATRADPARDIIMVPRTRGSLYDPSAAPLPDHYPFRLVGKLGIDATVKTRHDERDFQRAFPKNWGKVRLEDYL